MMLGRYLLPAGCTALCSVAFWAGCSSVEVTPGLSSSDAGRDSGALSDSGGDGDEAAADSGQASSGDGGGPSHGAPEVTFAYGSCPPVTACGGDPKGAWRYAQGGCVAELTSSQCPSATVSKSSIRARGTITIGATTIDRDVEANTAATIQIPASCAAGQSCSLAQLLLTAKPPTGAGFDTASCKNGAAAGSCECEVTKKVIDASSTTYTVAGHTITTADGKSYDYCVDGSGSKMTYRDKFQNILDANFVMSK